jgi:hypothetical protein
MEALGYLIFLVWGTNINAALACRASKLKVKVDRLISDVKLLMSS